MDLLLRFWSKVDVSAGPYACWPWTGAKNPLGYGKLGIAGKTIATHRWIMGHLRGRPLLWNDDTKEVVCHRCDNPPCCNPTHLYIGSMKDNMRDRDTRGRSGSGRANSVKTNCPRGHVYDRANTLIKKGSRNCRTCHRDRERRRRLTRGGD